MNTLVYFKKYIADVLSRYTLPKLLSRELVKQKIILDVGCGRTSSLKGITRDEKYLVGLDFYKPYLVELNNLDIYDECVLGDARKLVRIFQLKSFDCVISVEVLEHLTKNDGMIMVDQMKKIAKDKCVLITPNGLLLTYPGYKDNPNERHISGWSYYELKKLGFKVHGVGGIKFFWKINKYCSY